MEKVINDKEKNVKKRVRMYWCGCSAFGKDNQAR